jgi:CRISPR-associated Csx3 family protein
MILVKTWNLTQKDQSLRLDPRHAMPGMPMFRSGDIVILTGDAPIWDYGIALRMLQDEAMSIVAMYDEKLNGAVVVRSHSRHWVTGDIITGHIDATGNFRLVHEYLEQAECLALMEEYDRYE